MRHALTRSPATHPLQAPRTRRWLAALAMVAAAAAVLLGGRQLAALLPPVTAWVLSLGAAGPVLFVALYAIACVALVPASLLTLAAGATFGVWRGTAFVFAGASLGAVASFLAARHLARERIERRLVTDPRLRQIDRAVGQSGMRIMLLMRLSPAFPFGLQNYALGLTAVRLRDYVPALVGMLPGTLLYVYAGTVAGEVAAAASDAAPSRGLAYYALLGVGLVATLAVTVVIARIARRALAVPEVRDDG